MSFELMKLETTCRTCSAINDQEVLIPLFEGASSCKNTSTDIFAEVISFNLGVWEQDGLPQQICPKCFRMFEVVSQFRKQCQNVQVELRTYYFKESRSEEDNAKNEGGTKLLTVGESPPFVCGSNLNSIDECKEETTPALGADYADNDLNWECEYYIESEDDDKTAAGAANTGIVKIGHEDLEIAKIKSNDNKVYGSLELFEDMESCGFEDGARTDDESMDIIEYTGDTYEAENCIESCRNEKVGYKETSSLTKDNSDNLTRVDASGGEGNDDYAQNYIELTNKKPIRSGRNLPPHNKKEVHNDSEEISLSSVTYVEDEENKKNNDKQKPDHPMADYRYSCKYCGKGYHWAILLSNHIKLCPERTDVSCEICTLDFKSDELLDKHMDEVHPYGGPPMCPICSNTFVDTKKRDTHIRSVHGKREEHKCKACNKIFMSKMYLANHKRLNHVVGNYECPICHMKFSLLSKYRYHVSSHDENKKFKCKYCGKTFANSYRCGLHETSHTGERPHLCNICGLSFRYIFEFREHLNGHTTNSLQCEECGKHFHKRRQLKNHERLVHYSNPHPCDICGKMVQQALLARHKNRAHNEKNRKQPISYPFNCPLCPKGYMTAPSLASHVKIHTEIRRYVCERCGSAFKRADHLQLHIKRIHLKITYFTCECGKKFLEKSALNAHKITHTDETPFKCSLCPRTFKTNRSLQGHMLKHTGERPYACGICEMRFNSRAAVVIHTQKHSSDQMKLVEEEARLKVADALGCKMFTIDEKYIEFLDV